MSSERDGFLSTIAMKHLYYSGNDLKISEEQKKEKEKDVMDILLGEEFDSISLETNDTMALLNEILSTGPLQSHLSSLPSMSQQRKPLFMSRHYEHSFASMFTLACFIFYSFTSV